MNFSLLKPITKGNIYLPGSHKLTLESLAKHLISQVFLDDQVKFINEIARIKEEKDLLGKLNYPLVANLCQANSHQSFNNSLSSPLVIKLLQQLNKVIDQVAKAKQSEASYPGLRQSGGPILNDLINFRDNLNPSAKLFAQTIPTATSDSVRLPKPNGIIQKRKTECMIAKISALVQQINQDMPEDQRLTDQEVSLIYQRFVNHGAKNYPFFVKKASLKGLNHSLVFYRDEEKNFQILVKPLLKNKQAHHPCRKEGGNKRVKTTALQISFPADFFTQNRAKLSGVERLVTVSEDATDRAAKDILFMQHYHEILTKEGFKKVAYFDAEGKQRIIYCMPYLGESLYSLKAKKILPAPDKLIRQIMSNFISSKKVIFDIKLGNLTCDKQQKIHFIDSVGTAFSFTTRDDPYQGICPSPETAETGSSSRNKKLNQWILEQQIFSLATVFYSLCEKELYSLNGAKFCAIKLKPLQLSLNENNYFAQAVKLAYLGKLAPIQLQELVQEMPISQSDF